MSRIEKINNGIQLINDSAKLRLYSLFTFIASIVLFSVVFSGISGSPDLILWIAIICLGGSLVLFISNSSSRTIFYTNGLISIQMKTFFRSFKRDIQQDDVEYIDLVTDHSSRIADIQDVSSIVTGRYVKDKNDSLYQFSMSLRMRNNEDFSVGMIHIPLHTFSGPGLYKTIPEHVDKDFNKVFSLINAPIRVKYSDNLSGPVPDQVLSQVSGMDANKGSIKVETGTVDHLALKTSYMPARIGLSLVVLIVSFGIAITLASVGHIAAINFFDSNVFIGYLIFFVVFGLSLWISILLLLKILPKTRIRVIADRSSVYIKKQPLVNGGKDRNISIDTISSLNLWRVWKKDMGKSGTFGSADSLFHYYTIQTKNGEEFLIAYIQIYKLIIAGMPIIPAGKKDDNPDASINRLAKFLNIPICVKN